MSATRKQKVGKTLQNDWNRSIGRVGEDVACNFLKKRGFTIIERNYWRKWGEIDVIAEKKNVLRFVEVKSVSCENLQKISHETPHQGPQPEENVHPWKVKRLSRAIQTYLLKKECVDREWQFDILAVFLDLDRKEAKVRFMEKVII